MGSDSKESIAHHHAGRRPVASVDPLLSLRMTKNDNLTLINMLLKNTFVHHVHFWLNDKADLPKLIEGLNILVPITHIKQIHIGVPAGTGRDVVDASYDASLLILFDDRAAQDAYQIDPIHHEFVVNYAKPLCAKIVVQDSVDA